jgi:hypothetical protein
MQSQYRMTMRYRILVDQNGGRKDPRSQVVLRHQPFKLALRCPFFGISVLQDMERCGLAAKAELASTALKRRTVRNADIQPPLCNVMKVGDTSAPTSLVIASVRILAQTSPPALCNSHSRPLPRPCDNCSPNSASSTTPTLETRPVLRQALLVRQHRAAVASDSSASYPRQFLCLQLFFPIPCSPSTGLFGLPAFARQRRGRLARGETPTCLPRFARCHIQ